MQDCCGGHPEICAPAISYPCCASDTVSAKKVMARWPTAIYNVLFLCTGNTALDPGRRHPAQGGAGRFNAFRPAAAKGLVNPLRSKCLPPWTIPSTASLEGLDEFAVPGAPVMDFVFTVCDSAAGEACPIWPGHPMTAHWGIEDPAAVEGTDIEKERAFSTAARYMRSRIVAFLICR